MKHWLAVVTLICFGSIARASEVGPRPLDLPVYSDAGQRAVDLAHPTLPYPERHQVLLAQVPAGTAPAAASPVQQAAPAAPAQQSLDLFPIGRNFGASGQYQFGLDKSSIVAGCVERELHDGQWLAGPCRNIFVLAKNGVEVANISALIMYNAQKGNASYQLGLSYHFGPAVEAAAAKIASDVPKLDEAAKALENVELPPFLEKLNEITDLGIAGGYRPIHTDDVKGNWTWGIVGRMTLSVADAEALLPTPVGTQPQL